MLKKCQITIHFEPLPSCQVGNVWRLKPTECPGRALLRNALACTGLSTTHPLPGLFLSTYIHHVQAKFDNIKLVSLGVLHSSFPLPRIFWLCIFLWVTSCHSGLSVQMSPQQSLPAPSNLEYMTQHSTFTPNPIAWLGSPHCIYIDF